MIRTGTTTSECDSPSILKLDSWGSPSFKSTLGRGRRAVFLHFHTDHRSNHSPAYSISTPTLPSCATNTRISDFSLRESSSPQCRQCPARRDIWPYLFNYKYLHGSHLLRAII